MHSTSQLETPGAQTILPVQLLLAAHSMLQSSASQRISLEQAPGSVQRIEHSLPPQRTPFVQLSPPVHWTSQRVAPAQSTLPLEHALCELQTIRHGTPSGHFTWPWQLPGWLQSIVQTEASHSPIPGQTSSHLTTCGMPPLPPAGIPAFPAAPPAVPPA